MEMRCEEEAGMTIVEMRHKSTGTQAAGGQVSPNPGNEPAMFTPITGNVTQFVTAVRAALEDGSRGGLRDKIR